ncbi:helix-turn-helix domain-containing protein [Rhizobium sp. 18055]|uniref:helix-turn-helix domain-containing protein n=1 Tax=Rhizobium sp. 18055 TaxID=2681403 RepID=UPI001358DD9E|nr:helix-turn-helix transcriptional regulator [Rhizobium sp. 18055]
MIRNMATVMERQREARGMGKVEFAKYCGITAPSYLTFLDGTANPTLYMITRISDALSVTVHELLFGHSREGSKKTRVAPESD